MKFFRIAKWEKYQHYHKPRPPWLKIYTSINDINTDWRPLMDAQVGQLMRMMAYAALNDNAMPYEDELMQELLGLDEKLDLAAFKKVGVITVFKDRSSCLSREKSRIKSRQNPIAPSSEVRDQSPEVKDQRKESECSTSGQAEPAPVKVNNPESEKLCRLLAQKMVDNDPKARLPKTEKQKQTWLMDMERIHRIDERDWLIIRSVILWCQDDGFWRSNIRSPGKLRKQFPAMVLEMKRPAGSGAGSRAKNNKQALESVLEEMKNGQDSDSIGGSIDDLQRTDGTRQDKRILGGS